MSDSLQEIRKQLEQEAGNGTASRRTYLLNKLAEVEKQISDIPEADTAYRNDLNLLYKERDIIHEMLAELDGARSSQNSTGVYDHEAQLVERFQNQQAERARKKAKLTAKIDAFLKRIRNFMTPQGSRVPAPGYSK